MTGVKMGDELTAGLVEGVVMKVLAAKLFGDSMSKARNLPELGRIHASLRQEWFPLANP
jgi:hypothetical protein